MKRFYLPLLFLGATLMGCAESDEQKAEALYRRVNSSFESKQYALAKLQADSIKTLYPKAFEIRRQAMRLVMNIELEENRISQAYTDSMMRETRNIVDELTDGLYLDKDPRYQETGSYYEKRYAIESNLGRTYLRPEVNERGVRSIVIFKQGKAMNAHTLRLTASDDSFIELTNATTPYVMNTGTGTIERYDFTSADPDKTGNFMMQHRDEGVKVKLIGDKGSVNISLNKRDIDAIIRIHKLGRALKSFVELEKQSVEIARHTAFLTNRLQADSAAVSPIE